MTGQDLITTSIIAMESFLSNNVPFNDTTDIITYIRNILSEEHSISIMDYLDEGISKDELLDYLVHHSKNIEKINSELVKSLLQPLEPEQIARLFYKNQIIELIKRNSWFLNKLSVMKEFIYAEEPAKEMKVDLEDFKEKIIDFCHYDYLYEDRYKRAMKDKRKCIITIDTDLTKVWVH